MAETSAAEGIADAFISSLKHNIRLKDANKTVSHPHVEGVRYTRTPDKGRFVPGLAPEIKAWTAVCRFRHAMHAKYAANDEYIPAEIRYSRKTYWINELAHRVETNNFTYDDDGDAGDDDNEVVALSVNNGNINGDEETLSIVPSMASVPANVSVPLAPVVSVQQFRRAMEVARGTGEYKLVLLLALNSRHNKFVDILLDNDGTRINRWMDVRCRTMLHYAAESTHLHRIEYLLTKGADVNATDVNNQTALHMALNPESFESLYRQRAIYRCLVDHGVNLDVQDHRGETVLHKAVEKGDFHLMEMLLSRKARISLLDSKGRVAMERASKRSAKRVLALMISHSTRDEVRRLWAHLLSRQFVKSVFAFHQPTCSTCKRKMASCAALKVGNLRQWYYVHGNFKKEVKAIDEAARREERKRQEEAEAEADAESDLPPIESEKKQPALTKKYVL